MGRGVGAFPALFPVQNSGGSEVWLPEYDALSLLWVFHHTLRTGCVEFLLGDVSVIVGIDLRKVHDVRSGICLR